jgi:hypothetical protein
MDECFVDEDNTYRSTGYHRIWLDYDAIGERNAKRENKFKLQFVVNNNNSPKIEFEFRENQLIDMISEKWMKPNEYFDLSNDEDKSIKIYGSKEDHSVKLEVGILYTASIQFTYGDYYVWYKNEEFGLLTDEQKKNLRRHFRREKAIMPRIWNIISENDNDVLVKACR